MLVLYTTVGSRSAVSEVQSERSEARRRSLRWMEALRVKLVQLTIRLGAEKEKTA